MYTMRNRVTQGYERVDLEVVWKTIQTDLPELYEQVRGSAQSLSRDNNHNGMEP